VKIPATVVMLSLLVLGVGCQSRTGQQSASAPSSRPAAAGPAASANLGGEIGKPIPDFQLTDVNGNTISKSDYDGKILVVDFWASLCTGCTEKLVKYQPLWEKYRSRGVEFLVVSSDNSPETVKGWLKTKHPELTMPFVMKSDVTNNVFWGGRSDYVVPVAKVIDRRGVLRYEFGPDSKVSDVEQAIITLLDEDNNE